MLGWMVDTRDYSGADPTGNSESTSAIQQAMNEATAEGMPLYTGPGLYRVRRLNVPAGLVWGGYSAGGTGIDIAKQTRLGLIANTNDHMLYGASGVAHVSLTNIHFDGNKNNNQTGDVIHIDDVQTPEEAQWNFYRCFVDAAARYGVYVGAGRRAVEVNKCSVCYCGSHGLRINGSDANINRCLIGSNKGHGIGVGGTVCTVSVCDIYGNGTFSDTATGDGISVFSTLSMVSLFGNRIDQNKRNGILVSRNCEAILANGNILHGNSQHANGVFHDINVQSIAPSINVSDNAFGVDGNVNNKAGYGVWLVPGAATYMRGNVIQRGATVYGLTNAA